MGRKAKEEPLYYDESSLCKMGSSCNYDVGVTAELMDVTEDIVKAVFEKYDCKPDPLFYENRRPSEFESLTAQKQLNRAFGIKFDVYGYD